ncbi:hypothetical protein [Succiniclasticum ruminis]|uniref:Uncharacterized protein n=1 Tax=Succiniclasticum ruminis DSM 9236 TaxID=1123323 RepID=A0A1I1XWT8_9FIRM|nr:hypothetical protein [Succiniclasticum ruminis]SFE09980.1 hypothetical protein SAMN05216245_101390 [Succiniclasticum ruminis DSM 9236]
MAKPKNAEEWEIYDYLMEHYKEEGAIGLAPVKDLYYNKNCHMSWQQLKEDMKRVFHY